MKLIDHLGRLPADIYNKTAAAVDAVKWVQDSFGVILPGSESFYYSRALGETYGWNMVESACHPEGWRQTTPYLFETFSAIAGTNQSNSYVREWFGETPGSTTGEWNESGNRIVLYSGRSGGSRSPIMRSADLRVAGALFGFPSILATIPDGTEILEAKCSVVISGLTGYKITNDFCAGTFDSVDIKNDIIPVLGAVFPDGGFQEIGGIALSGEAGTSNVYTCTEMIKEMYSLKYTNCLGFCSYLTPSTGFELELPAMPAYNVCSGDPECDDVIVQSEYSYSASWSNVGFGNLFIKLKYPDEEKARIITPHWPVLD